MRILVKWTKKVNVPISAISVSPVNNQVIIGIGKVIIFYDAISGKELKQCEKHTQDVTCLAFRKDGKFFASGGKDNIVYFWKISDVSKPVNKITFQEPIIRMGYNPCLMILIAMSKTSLSLSKEKAASRVPLNNTGVDFCWTNDGMKYCIAYENGTVSIKLAQRIKNSNSVIILSSFHS